MSFSLTRFSHWYWSNGKDKQPVISSGSSSDSMKLSSSKKKDAKLSSKKVKKKWPSREERKRFVDQEYDVVLVPSDGVCLSASDESCDDSDWSIGWMEPHGPEFYQTDDADTGTDADNVDVADNSFAVLVPCYRNDCRSLKMEEVEEQQPSNQFLNVLTAFPSGFPAEGNKYMEQWLASLQNF